MLFTMCFMPHHVFCSIISDIQKVSPCSYLEDANTIVSLQCSNFTKSNIVCWCISLWCIILGWKQVWKVQAYSWRIQGILRDEYVVLKFFKVVCHTKIVFDGSIAHFKLVITIKNTILEFFNSICKFVVLFRRNNKIFWEIEFDRHIFAINRNKNIS